VITNLDLASADRLKAVRAASPRDLRTLAIILALKHPDTFDETLEGIEMEREEKE
jgi:hypothetical protein